MPTPPKTVDKKIPSPKAKKVSTPSTSSTSSNTGNANHDRTSCSSSHNRIGGTLPPPPPPPPPVAFRSISAPPSAPEPPVVPSNGPLGSFLVELLIFNGSPFKDHWSFFIRSHTSSDIGVVIHATGDVRNGFEFQLKRSHDLNTTGNVPTRRVKLQWVQGEYFKEVEMLNFGVHKIDTVPVCPFEASAHKEKAPGKTLNAVEDTAQRGNKITQKDCQSWLVAAADHIVEDGIFDPEVGVYLHAIKQ
ncbi:hypothetical protein SBOR_4358 [Sclerotinia borealis F-4128]|uniref:Uncharacterized protein n=1 Tax=Sclerotinia borealis (strain F-4128) TaxID=1432307 RepID=W9CH96_SCLBF|nr:hypothetical protein SBOR_4358 [Sclerotinia borealis F-4128]